MKKRKKLINIKNARSKEQLGLMKKIKKDGVCPFCRENLERYHEKPIIEETPHWVVTENLHPYEGIRTHLLFIYKTSHISRVEEMSQLAIIDLLELVAKHTKILALKGATLIMRFGDHDYTGGSVEHLHAHLISGVKKSIKTESVKVKIGFKNKE